MLYKRDRPPWCKEIWYHKAIRRDENFEYAVLTELLVGCSQAFRVDL